MNPPFSLPFQEFIRASFVANHKGLPEDECEAVWLHALELIQEIEQHCIDRHRHDIYKRAAWKAVFGSGYYGFEPSRA